MLNKLVIGNKYTVVGHDGLLEFNIQITLIDYIYKQYAQYEDVPYITFKKKGGRKIYTMYLNYKYSFIPGWQDISLTEKINDNLYKGLKYEDLKLNNVIVTGQVGTVKVYKNYESLIDYSFNLGVENGMYTEEYRRRLKEKFTELNYSLSNEMISYYKINHDYFLRALESLK